MAQIAACPQDREEDRYIDEGDAEKRQADDKQDVRAARLSEYHQRDTNDSPCIEEAIDLQTPRKPIPAHDKGKPSANRQAMDRSAGLNARDSKPNPTSPEGRESEVPTAGRSSSTP